MSKIIFLDIDGTILDTNKRIPELTKKSVFQLKDNGYEVAIATGRAPFMFTDIRQELGIDTYVSYNGQMVVVNNTCIYKYCFKKDEIENILNTASKNNHPIVYMGEHEMVANVDFDQRINDSINSLKVDHPRFQPDFYQNNDVSQLLLFCEEGEEKFYEKSFPDYNFIRWHKFAVDIIPKTGSKASGIAKALDVLGLDIEDSYAFGDGLNDIEMLEAVGCGVAMGNSHPKLKKVADQITSHVDENGIYHGLLKLGLID